MDELIREAGKLVSRKANGKDYSSFFSSIGHDSGSYRRNETIDRKIQNVILYYSRLLIKYEKRYFEDSSDECRTLCNTLLMAVINMILGWEDVPICTQEIPAILRLIDNPETTDEIGERIFKISGENINHHLMNIATADILPENYRELVEKCYRLLPQESKTQKILYETLKDIARYEEDNSVLDPEGFSVDSGLKDVISELRTRSNNFTEVPDWILPISKDALERASHQDIHIEEYDFTYGCPLKDEYLEDILLKKMISDTGDILKEEDNKNIFHEKLKQFNRRVYLFSTYEGKCAILGQPVDVHINSQYIEDFRRLGPLNPSENSSCRRYGGCRMLVCQEFTHENSDHPKKWFQNQECIMCGSLIARQKFALRKPLVEGGFVGCYCSFSCLKDNCEDYFESYLMGMMMTQIKEIGIYSKK